MPSPSPLPRRRRRVAALASVTVAATLLLGACGSDGSSGDTSSTDTSATATTEVHTTSLDQVTVSGDPGAKPTVTFDPSYVGSGDTSKVVSEGDGAVVTAQDRVTVDYLGVNGGDGSELGGTFGATAQKFFMTDQSLRPVITQALIGQKVGARVVVAVDATQSSGAWNIVVFDIRAADTIPLSAQGDAVAPVAGLPAVSVVDGVPTIAKPEGDPPADLVVQPLIQGTGPEVAAGQTVTMQYVEAVWASGAAVDSTWTQGAPAQLPVGGGQVLPGIDEALVGQKVGSRVLLVIPPDKGAGVTNNPQQGVTTTDTLVVVIDILASE